MRTIHLVRHAGSAPAADALRSVLPLEEDYTYIVATAALENLRAGLTREHQAQISEEGVEPQLVFHKAMRHFVGADSLLTRAEERIVLQRAIAHLGADPVHERLLRYDLFSWREALADLASRGIDLTAAIPDEIAEQVVSPAVLTRLEALQGAFRAEQARAGKTMFELRVRAYLGREYVPRPHLILEGFTFLTPLQRWLIETTERAGATVHLVYPYEIDQARAFAALKRTYAEFEDRAKVTRIEVSPVPRKSTLHHLQAHLFAAATPSHPVQDDSVTLRSYRHQQDEVRECVARIHARVDPQDPAAAAVAPGDIAIVTRNAADYRLLLQEEAHLQEARAGAPFRLALGVPPRALLLTPLGRFALLLYEIWNEGALEMSADQFETVLLSGWLGSGVQHSAEAFSAVRLQLFEKCVTEAEWRSQLAQARQVLGSVAEDSRMPVGILSAQTLRDWETAIEQILGLCEQLFSTGERTIGEHIRLLLGELDRLTPESLMREAEREVMRRIRDVFTDLSTSASMPMGPEEFGDVLNSLVREYEQAADEDTQEPRPDRVWVTTPEGIDQMVRPIVYYLGVDDRRVPRGFANDWPVQRTLVDAHIDLERYLFLAVVRSAAAELHFSYAERVGSESRRASPYLDQITRVTGIEVQSIQPSANPAVRTPPAPRSRVSARRTAYRLSELAHFRLCPFRYKMENLDTASRRYHNLNQLRYLAEGVWWRNILDLVETAPATTTMREQISAAQDGTRPEIRLLFPGLLPQHWNEIEGNIAGTADFYFGSRYAPTQIRRAAPVHVHFPVPGKSRAIDLTADARFVIETENWKPTLLIDDVRLEEWLWTGSPDERKGETEIEGVEVFSRYYDAVTWWRNAEKEFFNHDQAQRMGEPEAGRLQRTVDEITLIVEDIERGVFPKNPGVDQINCNYCPVRNDCLGLPEEDR